MAASFELPRPFGPYELTRRLATGAAAEVFLARARSVAGFEKAVAIKMIRAGNTAEDPDFVRLLVEEANIASRLSHKNIVQVIDLGAIDAQHYIAMEYVDGIDLAKLLSRLAAKGASVAPRAAAYIMREICEGLDHAHRKMDSEGKPLRIVHRDVSPANILISFVGEVKLTDFGIAKATLRATNTQAGVLKGKYSYMAPEQAKGHGVDARTDVFAAGLVLYELLTGRQAYPDGPLPLMLERLTRGVFEPADRVRPDLPQGLVDVLRRATAADPGQRHPSARGLADDLTAFLYTQDPSPPENEIARLLEKVSDSARSHFAPLGTSLVDDDDSEEVTGVGSASMLRAKTILNPTAAPPRKPSSPSVAPVRSGPAEESPAAPAPPNVARVRSRPPGASRFPGPPSDEPTPDAKADSPAPSRPSLRPPPPPAAALAKPVRAPAATPSAPPPPPAEAMLGGAPTVLRAPSLPSPGRPESPPRRAPLADEHPTEVMESTGPDAELLATAASIAPAKTNAPAPSEPALPARVTTPAVPAPPVRARVSGASPAATGWGVPATESLRPPAPSPSPDVTAQFVQAASRPRASHTAVVIAVGIGMVLGFAGAVIAVMMGH